VAISHIKGLRLCTVIVIDESAVGHDTIHIQNKDLHPLHPSPDLGIEALHNRRGLDAFFCTRLFKKT
jgi:hypothetical protein